MSWFTCRNLMNNQKWTKTLKNVIGKTVLLVIWSNANNHNKTLTQIPIEWKSSSWNCSDVHRILNNLPLIKSWIQRSPKSIAVVHADLMDFLCWFHVKCFQQSTWEFPCSRTTLSITVLAIVIIDWNRCVSCWHGKGKVSRIKVCNSDTSDCIQWASSIIYTYRRLQTMRTTMKSTLCVNALQCTLYSSTLYTIQWVRFWELILKSTE